MTRAQQRQLRLLALRTRSYVELLDAFNSVDDVHELRRMTARSEALLRETTDDEMALASRLLGRMDREDAEARSATPGR